jgi:hypothetical protein
LSFSAWNWKNGGCGETLREEDNFYTAKNYAAIAKFGGRRYL